MENIVEMNESIGRGDGEGQGGGQGPGFSLGGESEAQKQARDKRRESALENALAKMQEAEGGGARKKALPVLPNDAEWNQLAQLILEAEIRDAISTGFRQEQAIEQARKGGFDGPIATVEPVTTEMEALAGRVAATVEELMDAKGQIPPEVWLTKRWERTVRREMVRERLSAYEELALLSIETLQANVKYGKIKETGELLAVATLAERMSQQMNQKPGTAGAVGTGTGINVQINNINESPNGDLPGAGSLGTINLTLSNRVHRQLIDSKPIDPNSEDNFLNRIEMLSAKEVPEILGEIVAEKKTEE